MKEYIERDYLVKEAEAILMFRKQFYMDKKYIQDAAATLEWLKYYAPAANVVEVVRCKDCKYYAAMITDTVSGDMETAPWGICTQPWFNSDEYDVQENGYCSYGAIMDKEE